MNELFNLWLSSKCSQLTDLCFFRRCFEIVFLVWYFWYGLNSTPIRFLGSNNGLVYWRICTLLGLGGLIQHVLGFRMKLDWITFQMIYLTIGHHCFRYIATRRRTCEYVFYEYTICWIFNEESQEFKIESFIVWISTRPQTLVAIYRNINIQSAFRRVTTWKTCLGFILLWKWRLLITFKPGWRVFVLANYALIAPNDDLLPHRCQAIIWPMRVYCYLDTGEQDLAKFELKCKNSRSRKWI